MSVIPGGRDALRLGFVPALSESAGGVFQYSVSMARSLEAIHADGGLDLMALRSDGVPEFGVSDHGKWRVIPLLPPRPAWRRAAARVFGSLPRSVARAIRGEPSPASAPPPDPAVIRARPDVGAQWRHHGIDLVLFPQPHPLAFESGVPFIVAVHDLQHRLQPEFPEVSANGEWDRREYIIRHGVVRAERVLVDSETGKEHVMRFYAEHGARDDRIDVLPFLPALRVAEPVTPEAARAVRARLGIPEAYVLYPATFWPHKNHVRLVEALASVAREKGLRIHAVFSGSPGGGEHAGELARLYSAARAGGIDEQLHLPGYVSPGDLAALYAGATALVMPTFFGPTNIPILEAWAHGCPVLTSDIEGIREQSGDAALLVDPRSVPAIADGVYRLVSDASLRATLAARGRARLAAYTAADHAARLRESLTRAGATARSGR